MQDLCPPHYDVVIADHLCSLFTNTLSKAVHKQGGRGRENLMQTWQETKWTVSLYPSEIIFTTRKQKTENVVVQSQAKVDVVATSKNQTLVIYISTKATVL